jgi:hypothetical protein
LERFAGLAGGEVTAAAAAGLAGARRAELACFRPERSGGW